jgi:hypothetical protein
MFVIQKKSKTCSTLLEAAPQEIDKQVSASGDKSMTESQGGVHNGLNSRAAATSLIGMQLCHL